MLDGIFHRFSSCYGHDSRQEDIFETDVKPLIDVVYSGSVGSLYSTHFPFSEAKRMVNLDRHHLCVWRYVVWQDAYNARKSRATWRHSSSCRGKVTTSLKEILKLTCVEALFERKRQMHDYDVTLSASYMEIYRDEVYDLFVDRETVGLVLIVFQGSTFCRKANSPLFQ